MSPIEVAVDQQVPSRSRTFDSATVKQVLAYLTETGEDGNPVHKNVGFGSFNTAGSARSAGDTLNRLLTEAGATHKYAVTVFERDGKHVGVILNQPARKRPETTEATPAKGKGRGK